MTPEHLACMSRPCDSGGVPAISVDAVRLWDAGVRWDQIERKKGKYRWAKLDRAVAAAEAAGASEILYVLGSTPSWAASTFSRVDLYGPAARPIRRRASTTSGTPGRGQALQGQNHGLPDLEQANTLSFYNGGRYDGWIKLARLTKRASRPSARSTSALTSSRRRVRSSPAKFQTEFLLPVPAGAQASQREDRRCQCPPLPDQSEAGGPDARVASVRAVRRVMAVGLKKQLWDTEVNYGDRRSGAYRVVPKPKKAAGYVSRTYLDSARYRISRTFWYGWDINVLGYRSARPMAPRPGPVERSSPPATG